MELWKNGIQIAVTFIDNNNNEVSYLPIGGGTNVNNQSFNTILLLIKINRDCYNIEYFIKQHKEEIQNFYKQTEMIFSFVGVSSEKKVVFYDNVSGMLAARGVWMLQYFSHPDVSMLDGGMKKWKKENLSIKSII